MSDLLDLEDGLAYDPILFTFLFSDYPSACSPDSAYGTDIEDLPAGFESATKFFDNQNNVPASERRAEVIDGITKVEQVLGESGLLPAVKADPFVGENRFCLPAVETNPLIVENKVHLPAADFEPFLVVNKFGDSVLIENSLRDFAANFATRGYLEAEVFGITASSTDTELEIFDEGKGVHIPTTPIPARTLFLGESKLIPPAVELVHKADVQNAQKPIKRKNEDDGNSRAEGSHRYKRRCNYGGDDKKRGTKRDPNTVGFNLVYEANDLVAQESEHLSVKSKNGNTDDSVGEDNYQHKCRCIHGTVDNEDIRRKNQYDRGKHDFVDEGKSTVARNSDTKWRGTQCDEKCRCKVDEDGSEVGHGEMRMLNLLREDLNSAWGEIICLEANGTKKGAVKRLKHQLTKLLKTVNLMIGRKGTSDDDDEDDETSEDSDSESSASDSESASDPESASDLELSSSSTSDSELSLLFSDSKLSSPKDTNDGDEFDSVEEPEDKVSNAKLKSVLKGGAKHKPTTRPAHLRFAEHLEYIRHFRKVEPPMAVRGNMRE
ncbi:hypothetical protein BC937DRAFT_90181 [Endogone sp. FLAS-F59071]|nr:hypothetical protein BC937DRAFT_90181 [Endogone sp. FLAS-F59071]|eukprot:RUS17266.1 hypothetical protein BC937DRAFT_90181 [Endogone sp. FLAS-F59071]